MKNNNMVYSLNGCRQINPLVLWVCVTALIAALSIILALFCPSYADSFIGASGQNILGDLKWWVAIGGVALGIVQIVKGRMVVGIIGLVVTAIVFAFCAAPQIFGTFGTKILGIFGVQ